MKINGMAHVILSVKNVNRSFPFYESVFHFLEFETVHRREGMAYFVGGKTAVGIMTAEPSGGDFNQARVGLHHLCLRAYAREDIDRFHEHLCKLGAKIIHGPEEGGWAPGYYSVLFEDPDGIRLELNYVPGKGLLAEGVEFKPVGYEHL